MSFIWDLLQDGKIRQNGEDSRYASESADKAHLLLAHTERKMAHLSLITEAMWNLLKERTNCTDEELLAEIKKLNGSETKSGPANCPTCSRVVPQGSWQCIYCGAEAVPTSPFKGI